MVFDHLCSVTAQKLFLPHPPAEAIDNADAMPGVGVFYSYGCFNRPFMSRGRNGAMLLVTREKRRETRRERAAVKRGGGKLRGARTVVAVGAGLHASSGVRPNDSREASQ
jgi:hypothetical protein